jgi:diguanylate cyclase (GGDEF)-like protein
MVRDSGEATADRGRAAGDSTDDIELAAVPESGLTQTYDTAEREGMLEEDEELLEANVILIAHPENRRLGTRFRLSPGSRVEIGRSHSVEISLPEVLSISRQHALMEYRGRRVTLCDLGSTNGTFVNGEQLLPRQTMVLRSGDRFQVAGVHFKFLHERDPEHAYYETIYDLVTRDGLTEIYNKRKYEEEVEREFGRSRRHRRPLSLIMFDLDDFKQVNDNYGHLCGDFVLKRVVNLAQQVLRPEQVFARVGGDEFVILTPETESEGAERLARKVCDRVASLDYTYAEFVVRVSCSFGVAELDDGMRSPIDLYAAADQALMTSKRAGRNRVTVHRMAGEP